jgi:exonuclease VII small subunit
VADSKDQSGGILATFEKVSKILGAPAVAGAIVAPGAGWLWQHHFHKPPPAFLSTAAGLLVFLLVFLAIALPRWLRNRRAARAPAARGEKLAIYIASLGDDEESRTAQEHVIGSIEREFGLSHVELIRVGRHFALSPGVSVNEEAIAPARKARELLSNKHGDLLIWGRIQKHEDRKTQIELRFVTRDDQETSDKKIFGYGEKLTLDADFGPELGAALAATVATQATPAYESGRYIAKILKPIAARLEAVASHLPASMRSADRGRFFHAYATIQCTLGEQSGDSQRLLKSVTAYRAALEERTRERVPLDWAMTQNNLGNALQTLGARESGTQRLEQAVLAYQEALKERTRERVPLNWAATQYNLGNALTSLGERESGTERLKEAITAYRNALEELHQAPHYRQGVEDNLARAQTLLQQRQPPA